MQLKEISCTMIEVFKTSVSDPYYAKILIAKIHRICPGSRANFDLTDCDRILRVQSNGMFDPKVVIRLVADFGYSADVLPDIIPAGTTGMLITVVR